MTIASYVRDRIVSRILSDMPPMIDHSGTARELANLYEGTPQFRPSNPEYPDKFTICDIPLDRGTIQVIGLDRDSIDDVPNYDFSLSQVFLTPNGIFQTVTASADRAMRQITYTGDRTDPKSVARSKKRLASLRERYLPSVGRFTIANFWTRCHEHNTHISRRLRAKQNLFKALRMGGASDG